MLPYQIIDAFTSAAFAGNPAAVVLLPPKSAGQGPDDAWHLNIAREFNLAETAFLTQLEDHSEEKPSYLIRWFTIVGEFPLCGHATLASSSYLFTDHHPNATTISFQTTTAGPLSATRLAKTGQIELDFPADHNLVDAAPEGVKPEEVIKATESSNPGFVGKVVGWGKGRVLGWVVELAADVQLEGVPLDAKEFIPLGGYVVFTQAGTNPDGPHIKSRVIVPEEDNTEDPVTGSAHTMAAPYYLGRVDARARLPVATPGTTFAGDKLQARQISRRGGDLEVEWERETGRTKLRGHAVVVMEGKIREL